uniref:RRM domain-containing protein n=1 Tax=Gadus morhua TaxID=8049 RepID=A0A8C5FDC0_GADMO
SALALNQHWNRAGGKGDWTENGVDSHQISPSPVVHVRGLCEAVVEADLVEALDKFGAICYVMMMPFKRQALVEFSEAQSADRCVSCGAKEPVYIAGTHTQTHASRPTSTTPRRSASRARPMRTTPTAETKSCCCPSRTPCTPSPR